MCFRFLQVAWGFAKTGEVPHADHSHVEGVEEVDIDEVVANSPLAAAAQGDKK
jgi:C4-dicarboxylate transporter DctQ subunit